MIVLQYPYADKFIRQIQHFSLEGSILFLLVNGKMYVSKLGDVMVGGAGYYLFWRFNGSRLVKADLMFIAQTCNFAQRVDCYSKLEFQIN